MAVGGICGVFIHSRILSRMLIFILGSVAVSLGCYGVLLLVDAFDKHGSIVGDAGLFSFGLILLTLPAFVFNVVIKRTVYQRNVSSHFEISDKGEDCG